MDGEYVRWARDEVERLARVLSGLGRDAARAGEYPQAPHAELRRAVDAIEATMPQLRDLAAALGALRETLQRGRLGASDGRGDERGESGWSPTV